MREALQTYEKYKDSGVPWLSEIPSHWLCQRVKDLSRTISKGTTPSTEGFSFTDTGIRFIKAENIANTKRISKEPSFFISKEANKALSRSQLKLNDLLVVIAGATIGKIGILDQENLPANTNQAVCFIRFKKIKKSNFLYYVFVSDYLHKYIWYSIVQSAQPNLSMGVLSGFLVFLPAFHEQQAIATYLDTKTAQIDRKIDLLTQKAQRYEELKRSLINETVTRGLDKSVPMKDSGIEWIGEIPEHWELKRHKDNFKLVTKRCENRSLIKVGLENIESQTGRFIETESEFDGDGLEFRFNDILFGKLRPYLAKVYLSGFRGSAVGDIFVYRPRPNLSPIFSRHLMLSHKYIDVINSSTIGAKMPRVSSSFIANLSVPTPPLSEQVDIANYLDTKISRIDRIIQAIKTNIDKQKELRKTLINDVVTGKIKVA